MEGEVRRNAAPSDAVSRMSLALLVSAHARLNCSSLPPLRQMMWLHPPPPLMLLWDDEVFPESDASNSQFKCARYVYCNARRVA